MRNAKSISIGLALWAGLLPAQTVINGGRTVKGAWDASGAASTRPAKVGTAVPAACSSGEVFFNTAAAAGKNLYLCQPDNAWTQWNATGGGGVAGTANQMAFFTSASTVGSDDKIRRDAEGNLRVTGDLVVGPDSTSYVGGYALGVGMRLYFRSTRNSTCTAGEATLNSSYSRHVVDLNNQSSCALQWGEGDNNEIAHVLLCQGSTTATTAIVWPATVRGGMAAGGGPNTCMAQSFVYDAPRGAWFAAGAGIAGM
jgi:hypothetical protein